jgi:hypothetical protein
MVDIINWTLSDVYFTRRRRASRLTINSAVTTAQSFSIRVGSANPVDSFIAANMSSNNLPGTIGIFNSEYSKYVDLYLVTNLTSARWNE